MCNLNISPPNEWSGSVEVPGFCVLVCMRACVCVCISVSRALGGSGMWSASNQEQYHTRDSNFYAKQGGHRAVSSPLLHHGVSPSYDFSLTRPAPLPLRYIPLLSPCLSLPSGRFKPQLEMARVCSLIRFYRRPTRVFSVSIYRGTRQRMS